MNLLIENHRKIISMSFSEKMNLLLKWICKEIKIYFSNKPMPQAMKCICKFFLSLAHAMLVDYTLICFPKTRSLVSLPCFFHCSMQVMFILVSLFFLPPVWRTLIKMICWSLNPLKGMLGIPSCIFTTELPRNRHLPPQTYVLRGMFV